MLRLLRSHMDISEGHSCERIQPSRQNGYLRLTYVANRPDTLKALSRASTENGNGFTAGLLAEPP
ncbi:hypothetical protein EYF80_055341 [Liparis tanakae]|uniref:Uncharacterized protein n=1 Tax=Liparis tanakae TaxID=230148 RepID=A0A4Z2F0V6_9TELE|nr:hypothetical protein EYF80_055341 [Liparis tanakae]